MFAFVWSVGATTNEEGRKMFDGYLRAENHSMKVLFFFHTGMSEWWAVCMYLYVVGKEEK